MTQLYEPYYDWEDYKNGMWRKVSKQEEEKFLKEAIEFTGDHIKYGKAMQRVINEWPVTCRHNLTDKSINRQAFIGHAACSLQFNCPEYITRSAWKFLTDQQRIDANKEADKYIKEWVRAYHFTHCKKNNLHFQLSLFNETKN